MTTRWLDEIAAGTGVSTSDAELRLRRRGITADRALRAPRRIQIRRIGFTGEKKGARAGKIDFDWSPLAGGIWVLASEGNLVGKSSVLEILLWSLRGQPKGLQDDVRSWLDHVAVSLRIDDQDYVIDFDVEDRRPAGRLCRIRPDGVEDVIDTFESDEAFEAVMARFMMTGLDLDPLPSRSGTEGQRRTVEHGWLALSCALYFGGDHKQLLGDLPMAGMPARMLQMYVGLPWALTVMQANTAQKEFEQEADKASKSATEARAAASAARTRIQAELAAARKSLEAAPKEEVSIEALEQMAREVVRLSALVVELEGRWASLLADGALIGLAANEDERALRDIRENIVATTFFNGLQPSCCPRCETRVTNDRIKQESTSMSCSLCSEQIPNDQLEESNERIIEAEARRTASLAALDRLNADKGPAKSALSVARADLSKAQTALSKAATGDAFKARRAAELDIARLEGALRERSSEPLAEVRLDDADLVDNAVKASKLAFESDRGDLMDRLNAEILHLGKAFGVLGLESMALNTNAQMFLTKGGQKTSFSKLTAGERLRLRIATAIALIRVGRERGVGRHPGLLIIDSPGAEETAEINLATLLKELQAIVRETDGLQIFVASANAPAVVEALGPECCRVAGPDGFLW
jgi:hypothetical protein